MTSNHDQGSPGKRERPREITRFLEAAAGGDSHAFDRVVELVYDELVAMARREMRNRFHRVDQLTLEPAAIVNETLLKLLPSPPEFVNRRHFFAFASQVMRRVLVDYHRMRSRQKRGGGALRVTLTGLVGDRPSPQEPEAAQMVRVLERLESLDPRKCEVVQLKIFWGHEMSEIAETLGVSLSTVERDWRFSRSWLARELATA